MSTLARRLVRRLIEIRDPSSTPASVNDAAVLHLIDALGVGLAASVSRSGLAWAGLGRQLAAGGPSTILGQTGGARAAEAALVNGGLIHSLEFDDTHTGSIMHGSAVTASAALAVAEATGRTGQALIGAYTRGWEVLARLGLAAPGGFHAVGFQATSVAGTLSSALLSAELLELDEDQTVNALGIALSQSGGVMEFLSNGSSVKSLNPGWAAHGGVYAALLAQSGMTGPETALDGRWGLFAQFTRSGEAVERMAASIDDLGHRWHLPDAALKFYPCCHYLHPFIEAAGLLADRGAQARRIKRLVCKVPAGAAPVICEPWSRALRPESGHAARWSLPITVALRLVEGSVDLGSFENLPSAEVLDLASRTQWEPLPRTRFPERFEAEIECHLEDGRIEFARVDDVYGNVSRPADAPRVMAKFRDNASRALTADGVNALARAAESLTSVGQLAELGQALRCVRD
ncbi:MAG: hypothetical protein RL322_291 [Pseudomonadota bacterium]|jgi:2-methylcitrate dehydratase PrpD